MPIRVLNLLMCLGAAAHAEPTRHDLALDRVATTAAGGLELTVSRQTDRAVLKADHLEAKKAVTLQDGVFFATIRSAKDIDAADNVITVQLTATGYEGINGSRLTALFVLGMDQGNAYAILNPDRKPMFDSTANIERDLNYFLIGMTQPTLADCSEVGALRVLVAYQKKFPNRLLKMAMNDAEAGRFRKASGGPLCAQLPEAEADVDVEPREPNLPAPKKTPPPSAAAKPAPSAAPSVAPSANSDDDDRPEVEPPPNIGRAARPRRSPAPRRRADPYDRGDYGRGGYDDPSYGGERGYGY